METASERGVICRPMNPKFFKRVQSNYRKRRLDAEVEQDDAQPYPTLQRLAGLSRDSEEFRRKSIQINTTTSENIDVPHLSLDMGMKDAADQDFESYESEEEGC
jgi:hypothetical protein